MTHFSADEALKLLSDSRVPPEVIFSLVKVAGYYHLKSGKVDFME